MFGFDDILGAVAGPLLGGLFGGDDKGSMPQAPDPMAQAAAQNKQNTHTALANALMNRTNQYNPWFSTTYEYDPQSMAAQLGHKYSTPTAPTATTTPAATGQGTFVPDGDGGHFTSADAGAAPATPGTPSAGDDQDLFNGPFSNAAAYSQHTDLSPVAMGNMNARQQMLQQMARAAGYGGAADGVQMFTPRQKAPVADPNQQADDSVRT